MESLTDPTTGEYIPDDVTHALGEAAENNGHRVEVLAYSDDLKFEAHESPPLEEPARMIGVQVRDDATRRVAQYIELGAPPRMRGRPPAGSHGGE